MAFVEPGWSTEDGVPTESVEDSKMRMIKAAC
jgi:hypothetical protein